MTRYENTVFCDNCGAEITWAPFFLNGGEYCCRDCAEHRVCRCGERMDWQEERRTHAAGNGGEGEVGFFPQ